MPEDYEAPPLEDGQSPTRPPYTYPVEEVRIPVLTELHPSTVKHTVTQFVVNIVGTGFAIGDKVFSDDLEATEVVFVDTENISAAFTGIVVETPREVDIKVRTAAGEFSNALPLAYVAPTLPDPEPAGGE